MAAQLWQRIECPQEDTMIRAHISLPYRYTIFVRELCISASDHKELSHHPDPGLTRLASFSLLADLEMILVILDQNPGLQNITFRWQDLEMELMSKLIQVLGRRKNLKYQDLSVGWISTTGAIEFLLKSVPGLEHLRIIEWNQAAEGLYAIMALATDEASATSFITTEDETEMMVTFQQQHNEGSQNEVELRRFLPLQNLHVVCNGIRYEEVLESVVSSGSVLKDTLEVLEIDHVDGPGPGRSGRGSTLKAEILQKWRCVRVEKASVRGSVCSESSNAVTISILKTTSVSRLCSTMDGAAGSSNNSNPLGVPEILALIGKQLSPPDLARACRVQKSWFSPFASLLWRTIRPGQLKHSIVQCSLPRYSVHVRELVYPRDSQLPQPGNEFSGLITFSPPTVQRHNSDHVLQVISNNKNQLKRLTVRWSDLSLSFRAISTLAGLKSLLYLDLEAVNIPNGAIELILDAVPGLESLRFEEYRNPPRTEATVLVTKGINALLSQDSSSSSSSSSSPSSLLRSDGVLAVRSSYKLKQLKIKTNRCSFHPLLTIIQSSPSLIRLEIHDADKSPHSTSDQTQLSSRYKTLARSLHESCRQLRDLVLGGQWMGPLDLDAILSCSIPKNPPSVSGDHWLRLRTLHVTGQGRKYRTAGEEEGGSATDVGVVEAVSRGAHILKDTLEDLTVVCDHSTDGVGASRPVVQILRTFKKLRILNLHGIYVEVQDLFNGDPFHFNEDEDELCDDEGSYFGPDDEEPPEIYRWACRNLKVLNITIINQDDSEWYPEWEDTEWDDYRLGAKMAHQKEEDKTNCKKAASYTQVQGLSLPRSEMLDISIQGRNMFWCLPEVIMGWLQQSQPRSSSIAAAALVSKRQNKAPDYQLYELIMV
ncbi:hypothetical protein BGZ83_000542 [Gryganskiella cystojenkinii]|nr:hypothetical protein BGZ83_000542 [Gryganskiella cystojenkinii]